MTDSQPSSFRATDRRRYGGTCVYCSQSSIVTTAPLLKTLDDHTHGSVKIARASTTNHPKHASRKSELELVSSYGSIPRIHQLLSQEDCVACHLQSGNDRCSYLFLAPRLAWASSPRQFAILICHYSSQSAQALVFDVMPLYSEVAE